MPAPNFSLGVPPARVVVRAALITHERRTCEARDGDRDHQALYREPQRWQTHRRLHPDMGCFWSIRSNRQSNHQRSRDIPSLASSCRQSPSSAKPVSCPPTKGSDLASNKKHRELRAGTFVHEESQSRQNLEPSRSVTLRASVRHADAVSEVASGRPAVGSALMLMHLFGSERVSPAARERVLWPYSRPSRCGLWARRSGIWDGGSRGKRPSLRTDAGDCEQSAHADFVVRLRCPVVQSTCALGEFVR